jgi:SAM-dependent methyltransferase
MTNWTDVAAWYNVLNPWGESDNFYLDLVMSADRVLDVGCGTGTLLRRASDQGHQGRLCGLDPDPDMLALARASDRDPDLAMLARARDRIQNQSRNDTGNHSNDKHIEWVLTDAASAPWTEEFDLVVMTGHAFQQLVTDEQIRESLAAIWRALAPDGRFAFDTRHPQARAWEDWHNASFEARNPDGDTVTVSYAVQDVTGGVVTLTETLAGQWWNRPQVEHGALRFLDRHELAAHLTEAGFAIEEQFGDWHRTKLTESSEEIVTIARKRVGNSPC